MKRLSVFSIRSFIGPFIVTFAISMFMLIMQFLWKYIDDLMGKGIELSIILELFVYVSATLIPLALPLAMLLSSIMTMGNLAENNELTALKSAGLSLYRILRPLSTIVIIISIFTFLFSNFVIPVATLKWRALIYDIQSTKIATILTPGTYSSVLDGYSIKIKEGNDQSFKDIVIHDHTSPNTLKTIKAASGEVFKSRNGSFLIFKLKKGEVLEELHVSNLAEMNRTGTWYPTRRSNFEESAIKVDISGFKLSRSNEDVFKNEYEMWNIFQINEALDSVQESSLSIRKNFASNVRNEHAYFRSQLWSADSLSKLNPIIKAPDRALKLSELNKDDLRNAYLNNISRIRRIRNNLEHQKVFLTSYENGIRQFEIEFHRKFALAVAVFVLFFVGAPLGAIVKKGGFGAPVVIAALLFMIYYVLTELGKNLADTGVTSPVVGTWLATLILAPVAFILMRSAALDSRVFDKEFWKKLFKFKFS